MRTTTLMGLVSALACATPALAGDEHLLQPGFYASVTFGGATPGSSQVFLNGVPLMTAAPAAGYRDADPDAPRERANVPAIIAASALGAGLILVLLHHGLDDAFEDWDGGEVNIGNDAGDGGKDACSGVEVNDDCIGNGS